LLDSIYTEVPSLTKEQQQVLYSNVMEDVADEPIKGLRMAYLRKTLILMRCKLNLIMPLLVIKRKADNGLVYLLIKAI